jgi:hypothetical protein
VGHYTGGKGQAVGLGGGINIAEKTAAGKTRAPALRLHLDCSHS